MRFLDEQPSHCTRSFDEEAEFVVRAAWAGSRLCIAVASLDFAAYGSHGCESIHIFDVFSVNTSVRHGS